MEESQLDLPLLSDVDRDEEIIISQLLNTNNDNDEHNIRSSRCSQFKDSSERRVAISFALLLLFGFMSSLWSAASCALIDIDYNKGGVELTIEGLGFWRYEQKVTNGTQITNYCAPYGQKVRKEINLDGFFPEDKTLQAYSLVSPSAAFMSIFALMICIVEVRFQPEIIFGRLIPEYVDPLTTIRSSALAGVLLMMGGIIQMVATFSLLNYHPKSTASGYESPLCNPAYSHCKLGLVGIWSVFGSLSLFVVGVISCYSSRRIARRHGKGGICCAYKY